MRMDRQEWVARNRKYTLTDGVSGFSLNVAGMKFTDVDIDTLADKFTAAHCEMQRIESGEVKNPDEGRKVTHFTDRMDYPVSDLFGEVEDFAASLRSGSICGGAGKPFDAVVVNGIGGSALGPQLLQFAINGPYWNELSRENRNGGLRVYFLDNTDPAGFADLLTAIDFETTLFLTISKSGGTQETLNNLLAASDAYHSADLDFARHAAAITMPGSRLDQQAKNENWLKVFPMPESIGGRTSETSIVGHLPAALAGINFRALLAGACEMDTWTRNADVRKNPAYLLAAMWYIAGDGRGDRNMVIVPYADRLILLSRYLQQLVMESLGKEKDLTGKTVHQGLNVFGNKGGTDAHAFIQQLNDGRDDFFATFIEVWRDVLEFPVEDGVMMSDYLHGFQAGLEQALLDKGRQVINLSIREVDEANLGRVIGLYERAVAFYAELIGINAFHQPGVQAYKLTSNAVIELNKELQAKIKDLSGFTGTASELAERVDLADQELAVAGLLAKFAENSDRRTFSGVRLSRQWHAEQGWVYRLD